MSLLRGQLPGKALAALSEIADQRRVRSSSFPDLVSVKCRYVADTSSPHDVIVTITRCDCCFPGPAGRGRSPVRSHVAFATLLIRNALDQSTTGCDGP